MPIQQVGVLFPLLFRLIAPAAKEVRAGTPPYSVLVAYHPVGPTDVEVAVVERALGAAAEVVDVGKLGGGLLFVIHTCLCGSPSPG